MGTPLLLPQSDPNPVRKLETSGIEMHGGVAGRGTDGRESISGQNPLQKKQLIFQGGSFFFFLFRLFPLKKSLSTVKISAFHAINFMEIN